MLYIRRSYDHQEGIQKTAIANRYSPASYSDKDVSMSRYIDLVSIKSILGATTSLRKQRQSRYRPVYFLAYIGVALVGILRMNQRRWHNTRRYFATQSGVLRTTYDLYFHQLTSQQLLTCIRSWTTTAGLMQNQCH